MLYTARLDRGYQVHGDLCESEPKQLLSSALKSTLHRMRRRRATCNYVIVTCLDRDHLASTRITEDFAWRLAENRMCGGDADKLNALHREIDPHGPRPITRDLSRHRMPVECQSDYFN